MAEWTIWNALRDALRIISGKNIFICKSGKSADFPDLLFHGEGVVAENCLSTVALFLMKKGEDATRSAALSQKAALQMLFAATTSPVKMG